MIGVVSPVAVGIKRGEIIGWVVLGPVVEVSGECSTLGVILGHHIVLDHLAATVVHVHREIKPFIGECVVETDGPVGRGMTYYLTVGVAHCIGVVLVESTCDGVAVVVKLIGIYFFPYTVADLAHVRYANTEVARCFAEHCRIGFLSILPYAVEGISVE